jgi:hypothetical protein
MFEPQRPKAEAREGVEAHTERNALAPPLAPIDPLVDEPPCNARQRASDAQPAPPLMYKPATLSREQRRMLAAISVAVALAVALAAIAAWRF